MTHTLRDENPHRKLVKSTSTSIFPVNIWVADHLIGPYLYLDKLTGGYEQTIFFSRERDFILGIRTVAINPPNIFYVQRSSIIFGFNFTSIFGFSIPKPLDRLIATQL